MSKPVRRFLLRRVLPPIAACAYRKLGQSWRYVTENERALAEGLAGERPLIGAFLHARTFGLLHYFSLPQRGRWILMCSQSRDGDLMTKVEESLGFRVVRGSSGKGGARALVEMIKAQRSDRKLNSCLAVDGSRGPRGVAQLGILTLAQKTGGLVLPVAASCDRAFVYRRSWDRSVFPRPRATVHVRFGVPFPVPPDLDADRIEALRSGLERTLLDLHEALDRTTGFRDTQPLQGI